MIRRAVPCIADLRHTRLCYRQDHYCGHPRQLSFRNYGNGETVVGHYHASSRYATGDDVSHSSATGYFSRAKMLLQRTLDHGETWRPEDEVVIGDNSRPLAERLRDGRIVVIFGRRKQPFGMGLIVSEDDGATWSAEAVIRADASDGDLGYPVATQLEDGRIFTAYYFMENDGNGFGGTRHIAASFFRLP